MQNLYIQRLSQAIDELETLLLAKNDSNVRLSELMKENEVLKIELKNTQNKFHKLQETSQEVIEELNKSIKVIEDYFKKENGNN
jgi:uncharacterized coiled-coil DUF342 family protein